MSSLTDEEYADFVQFAARKEFDARTESQIEMERVLEAAEREGLDSTLDGLKEEMDGLLERISLTKEDFLEANKSTVKSLLEDEIALKFYLRAGGAESALRQDSQLPRSAGTLERHYSGPGLPGSLRNRSVKMMFFMAFYAINIIFVVKCFNNENERGVHIIDRITH